MIEHMDKKKIIRNVRVLCFDKEDSDYLRANILISGSKIEAIGPGAEFQQSVGVDEEIDGSGKLAIPGLINGHFHSPANLMKGSLSGLPLEIFMLYEVPPLSDLPPPPRLVYIRTLLGAIEMLKRGITSVQDDAFFVPYPDADSIDALMNAYGDSGIRATAALDQPNVLEYDKYPYLSDILPETILNEMASATIQSTAELTELYRAFIEKWHGARDGRLETAVSCSAPHRVTPEYLHILSKMSRDKELPFYIHVLETKVQRVFGERKLGQSLIQYIKNQNILDHRVNIIHAIWIDEDDMAAISESGATIAHNPVCNLRLGSGIMPFRKIRDFGIPVCLGTDEALADDSINVWNALKMAGMIHNITEPDYRKWPQAEEVLECLFRGGSRAMGKENDIGSIEPGKQADIALLDLNQIPFTPLNDIKRQLVYCEDGSSVCLTMVGGEVVVRDGVVLTANEEAVKIEARQLMNEHLAILEAAAENAAELEPFYREMYLRAAGNDVGLNRWAADAASAWMDKKK